MVDGSYYLPTMKRNAREEYLAGHIPGAVYFDIDAISDHSSDLPHMLPSPEGFSSAMRNMGIGDGITIVVYDGVGLFSAPRVWWTFRTFGVRDVYILDGGMPKWKAEGRPLDFGEVRRTPRHFTVPLQSRRGRGRRRREEGARASGHSGRRRAQRRPLRRHGARAAAGAAIRPHAGRAQPALRQRCFEDGRLVATGAIGTKFAEAGVDLDKPVVTTCGSGVTRRDPVVRARRHRQGAEVAL